MRARRSSHALELAEQLGDRRRSFGRVASREDAGPAAERRDLDARVLAEHPAVRVLAAEPRLQRARSRSTSRRSRAGSRRGRAARSSSRAEAARARAPCAVARAERRLLAPPHLEHAVDRRDARHDGRRRAAVASSTSTATERRSPSCAISSDTTRPRCPSIASMIGAGLPPAGISTSSRSSSGRNRRDDAVGDDAERPEDEQRAERRDEGGAAVAGAGRHPDRGDEPERRGGREAPHREALADDRAGAEEADAGHDLRRDPRRVDARPPRENCGSRTPRRA